MFFRKGKEPKPEYNGPPEPGEPLSGRDWAFLGFGVVMLSIGASYVPEQVGKVFEIGLEDYIQKYIVPLAEDGYEWAVEHPERIATIAITAVLLPFAIKWLSRNIFKGDDQKSRRRRSVTESILKEIKNWLT